MKTPIHLWIIGILSLLWNAGGGYDYIMTKIGDATYLSQMPAGRIAMLDTAPLWFDFGWGIGVWLSIAGSLLLLARSRLAVTAFGVSLLGFVASFIYTYGIATPSAMTMGGTFEVTFTALIFGALLLQLYYARAMRHRGVLR